LYRKLQAVVLWLKAVILYLDLKNVAIQVGASGYKPLSRYKPRERGKAQSNRSPRETDGRETNSRREQIEQISFKGLQTVEKDEEKPSETGTIQ